MKTAVYTICKNELKYVDKWLYYGKFYDYRVLLDTGSTDGTWEKLQAMARVDNNLIIEQRIFTPWNFSVARNYNLAMVPDDVDWCLSPDLDEYFTINTLDELHAVTSVHPNITNLACDRMDVYSYTPRVGPPDMLSTNKIHRRNDYIWVQPIYEHLKWKHPGNELELYSSDIFLIHDQDFQKEERPEMYVKMLTKEYEKNPTNTWCLWFLVMHHFKEENLDMFVKTGCDYLRYSTDKTSKNYTDLAGKMKHILFVADVPRAIKSMIQEVI